MTMRQQDLELVWPTLRSLHRTNRPLVYLDLNHWISLAQARSNHPAGSTFQGALEFARQAKRFGRAAFALSGSLYMEMAKIADPAQRFAVGDVMEELAEFSSLVCRVVIMELEMDAALRHRGFSGPSPSLPTINVIGHGFKHAFGLTGGPRIMGPDGDETREFRERFGPAKFDMLMEEQLLNLERSVLRGPTDNEVADLRSLGWAPEVQIATAGRRARQETEQSARLDEGEGEWRRGDKLQRIVMARELITEFHGVLARALGPRGITLEQIAENPDEGSRFVRSMPSTEVSLTIKTAWHRNPDKKWTANDVYDIDALAIAVPYCDVVVTEKACHHVLTTAGLDRRMRTTILRRLDDLPTALSALTAAARTSERDA